MAQLIYEDDELQALWRPGTSPFLLVTFGDMLEIANGITFSAEAPVSKNDITCLGIMAKRANWYPRKNLANLLAAVSDKIGSYNERILYGSSMGGHGAIKASGLVNATTVIALCPQWSINPADKRATRLGWEGEFDPIVMSDMKITQQDISGSLFLFSDPGNSIDENHRSKIAAMSSACTSVPVFFCDHHVAPVLAGSDNLKNIIGLCRSNKPRELLRLVNLSRRQHFARFRCVTERGLRKKPSLTLRAVMAVLPDSAAMKRVFNDVRPLLHEVAVHHADTPTWSQYVGWLIENTSDANLLLSLLSSRPAKVRPSHF